MEQNAFRNGKAIYAVISVIDAICRREELEELK